MTRRTPIYSKQEKSQRWATQACLHHPKAEGRSLCCKAFRCRGCHEGHLRKNHPNSWILYQAMNKRVSP